MTKEPNLIQLYYLPRQHLPRHRPRHNRMGPLHPWLHLYLLHPNCRCIFPHQQIGAAIHNQKIVYRYDRLPLRNLSTSLDQILLCKYTYQQYEQDCISPKKTLLSLVDQYYQLSGNLRKLQKQWFARPINSFASWTVDELRYWLRTAKRILTNSKLSPSSKLKELKQYTILDDKNRNPDSTHLIHEILPVRHLQNYKDTPLSRCFLSPVVSTDQQHLIPR